MRLPLAFTFISLSLAACGGGDDGGSTTADAGPGKEGFDKPPVTLKANVNMGNDTDGPNWVEVGDADLSCLNTPSTLGPSSVDVSVSTTVADFQSDDVVPGATVSIFKDLDLDNPFQTVVADGTSASIQFTVPTGTTRFGYKMTADTAMPTLLLNQKLSSPTEATQTEKPIKSVSNATANLLPALVNQSRTPGTGVAAGAFRDCQDREVSGFVATMSSTSATATAIDGAQAFYFDDTLDMPVNHRRATYATKDGLFMIIQIPTASTSPYVQLWGYLPGTPTGGDMTLVAELKVVVLGDTVITGSYEPVRSN